MPDGPLQRDHLTPIDLDRPLILAHARGEMTMHECAFWERLRAELRARNTELAVIAHHWPKTACDVPILRVRNMLDTSPRVWPERGWSAWLPETPLPKNASDLLEREAIWRGNPTDEHHLARREHGLRHLHAFYASALRRTKPALVLIWNGTHAQELLLANIARRAGANIHYCERGPIPHTLHTDPHGILAESDLARRDSENLRTDNTSRANARAIIEALRNTDTTWWPQPESEGPEALRNALDLTGGDTLLLFAGQVDADAQNLFFNPHYSGGPEAFETFCRWLPTDRPDLFILGKHHPKATTPADTYRAIIDRVRTETNAQWRAEWIEDCAINDAIAAADRVAAVNSTALFEAACQNKPTLMLGKSILSNKAIAHEVKDPRDGERITEAWLKNPIDPAEPLTNLIAHAINRDLYAMTDPLERLGVRPTAQLADTLIAATSTEPFRVKKLPKPYPFFDEVALWDDARA